MWLEIKRGAGDFNPRFPWGKRLAGAAPKQAAADYFNPRFPWGKRRVRARDRVVVPVISIHASRGGSDL